MNYVFSIIVISIIFSFRANAQSFQLYEPGGALIPNNSTIDVWGDINAFELDVYIDVKNSDSIDHHVHAKKYEMDITSHTQNYFCWDVCFTPETFVSSFPLEIKSGESTQKFSGHYIHSDQLGASTVRYCFFDEVDTMDRVCVNVNFHLIGVGIDNPEKGNNHISAIPNPADRTTTFSYLLSKTATKAKIYIYDLLGKSIKEIILSTNDPDVKFETGLIKSGVYFYSFEVDGKVLSTERLIVVHSF